MEEERGILISTVPQMFLPTTVLQGVDEIGEGIFSAIDDILEQRPPIGQTETIADKQRIVDGFSKFSPAIIAFAGLSDGINPCAFTTLIFFISFLTLYSYDKKKILISGVSFMIAIFLTYLLLGIGGTVLIGKIEKIGLLSLVFKYSIASFAIILGVLALYDYILYKKTSSAEGLKLQLPAFIKNMMHKHIGSTYREKEQFSNNTIKLIMITFISGVLISLLESVCTGQIYLPTITYVMRMPDLRIHAFSYLLLYNIAFILPLGLIFVLTYKGVSSEKFSLLTKRHLGKIKISYVILFFALGIFLILS